MVVKDKLIGIILIVLGAIPFLLKVKSINDAIGKYTFLTPASSVYPIIIIILGLFLLVSFRPRTQIIRR